MFAALDQITPAVKAGGYVPAALLARIRRSAYARMEANRADWFAMASECKADGYRPSHCIHGTSQWTDWDNICGPCEDGLDFLDMAAADVRARVYRVEVLYGKAMTLVTAIREFGEVCTGEVNVDRMVEVMTETVAEVDKIADAR